jgi:hypothetical protein
VCDGLLSTQSELGVWSYKAPNPAVTTGTLCLPPPHRCWNDSSHQIVLLALETLGQRYDSERLNVATARRSKLHLASHSRAKRLQRSNASLATSIKCGAPISYENVCFPTGPVQASTQLDYAFIASSFLIASLTMLPHNFACGLV